MKFLVQFADGDFLADYPLCATHLASFALAMNLPAALRAANLVPGARVVEMQAAGTYTPEDLRDSEQFYCGVA